MEFTCFYYHSNYNAYSITFINNKKGLFQLIINNIKYDFDIEEEFEVNFNITENELKKIDNLYKMYILSTMMTKNKNNLEYNIKTGNWVIEGVKNWKGLYYTKHNSTLSSFVEYPTEISIIYDNENIKNYYIGIISHDNKDSIYNRCNLKSSDDFISSKLQEYSLILNDVEKVVYKINKYNLFFNKTISKNIILKDDVKKIIYNKLMIAM